MTTIPFLSVIAKDQDLQYFFYFSSTEIVLNWFSSSFQPWSNHGLAKKIGNENNKSVKYIQLEKTRINEKKNDVHRCLVLVVYFTFL